MACVANTDLLQALKGERLCSVFSPDGTLISVSAAPHCGDTEQVHEHRVLGITIDAEIKWLILVMFVKLYQKNFSYFLNSGTM